MFALLLRGLGPLASKSGQAVPAGEPCLPALLPLQGSSPLPLCRVQVAISYYFYITFLGYSALPFLERTEVRTAGWPLGCSAGQCSLGTVTLACAELVAKAECLRRRERMWGACRLCRQRAGPAAAALIRTPSAPACGRRSSSIRSAPSCWRCRLRCCLGSTPHGSSSGCTTQPRGAGLWVWSAPQPRTSVTPAALRVGAE